MASGSKSIVVLLTSGFDLYDSASPVVDRILEPGVTRKTSNDVPVASALLGYRCSTALGTQSVEVSFCEELTCFAQHRRSDKHSYAWYGHQYRGIGVLSLSFIVDGWQTKLRENVLDVLFAIQTGTMVHSELRNQEHDMAYTGGNDSWCHV